MFFINTRIPGFIPQLQGLRGFMRWKSLRQSALYQNLQITTETLKNIHQIWLIYWKQEITITEFRNTNSRWICQMYSNNQLVKHVWISPQSSFQKMFFWEIYHCQVWGNTNIVQEWSPNQLIEKAIVYTKHNFICGLLSTRTDTSICHIRQFWLKSQVKNI